MAYKAVIFDLDGTVLDTAGGLAMAVNRARAASGLDEQPMESLIGMVGNGARRLIARSLAADSNGGVTWEDIIDSSEVSDLLEKFRACYMDLCVENSVPYNGIIALLRDLHEHGVRTAVLSNKDHPATFKLCDFYFHDMLDDIRGHREGVAHKPAPEPVLLTLERLGVSAEDTVLVGDSEVDILTASGCGMKCISVDWGFKSRDFLIANGASVVVSSVKELEELLLSE